MESSDMTSPEDDLKDFKGAVVKKICKVCGDKALGYNFNAITCESCKAFFRRNANTDKTFKCPFKNNCEITPLTRKFCQKCRLKKCFDIGMLKEYILSEQDKAEKRRKIEQNRIVKRTLSTSEDTPPKKIRKTQASSGSIQYCDLNSTTSSPQSIDQPCTSQHDVCESGIDSKPTTPCYFANKQKQKSVNPCRSSQISDNSPEKELKEERYSDDRPHSQNNFSDCDGTSRSTDDLYDCVDNMPHDTNSIESIVSEAVKLEFEAFTSVAQMNSSSRELNEVERAKLNELIVANKALHAPIDDDISDLLSATPQFKEADTSPDHATLLSIINLTAVAIRRLIKMAKKINSFKNMCEEDQIALLKGGSLEMMVLRSTMTYDCDRNSWEIPHAQKGVSSIHTDVLKLAKGNIYQCYEHFISTFDYRWRTDENIILIMSAIVLFTSDRPKVVHSDVVKLERNSYYYLLRRYLESIYPGCEAKSTFLKLIRKIKELARVSEEIISVYLDVGPVEPLLIEIFDL